MMIMIPGHQVSTVQVVNESEIITQQNVPATSIPADMFINRTSKITLFFKQPAPQIKTVVKKK